VYRYSVELENACLEAGVDLSDTEINVGSTRAVGLCTSNQVDP
jgi:hypothetical protein